MSRRRFAISSAIVAVVFGGVLPYVVIQAGWTFDLTDRIATVVTVALLISLGIGAAIHAFRGKPFTSIGE